MIRWTSISPLGSPTMTNSNEITYEKIRSNFLELIREKGYSKTTFKEVASASGMTRQNLYYYYESKETMLKDVIEEFFDRLYLKMVSYKINPNIDDYQTMSKSLVSNMMEALENDIDIARCFYSNDVEKLFIRKSIAFLKRMLGGVIRNQDITVKNPLHIHFIALQMAGAVHFPLKEWIVNESDISTDDVINLGYPMLDAAISTLMDTKDNTQ